MKTALGRFGPLTFALGLYAVISLVLLRDCLQANGGVFTYTLDDAYIHLAIAKNLANHAVFGITPYQFSSSESSLLWGILLAALYKATPRAAQDALLYAPLALNLIAGSALLVLIHRIGAALSPALRATALVGTLLVAALPWLTFAGMEHTLQTVLVLAFVHQGVTLAVRPPGAPISLREGVVLGALGFLAIAVRYEDAFAVAVVCLLLLVRRRWVLALAAGAAALTPIVAYALVSVPLGGLWLPSSIALKSRFSDPGMRALFAQQPEPLCLVQLADRPYLLTLFAVCLSALLLGRRAFWRASQLFSVVMLVSTLLNLQSALQRPMPGVGILCFFRYDAYLVTLGIVALVLQWNDLGAEYAHRMPAAGRCMAGAALLFLIGATGYPRAQRTLAVIPQASHNIYEQQWQMAEFVARHYPGQTVVLNDIGAVNYKADIQCLDLVGLGSPEIVAARYSRQFTGGHVDQIADRKRARIALVYRAWFEPIGLIPPTWKLVAQWTIRNNVICGADTVGFYAISPTEVEPLTRNFVAFSERIPSDIQHLHFVDVGAAR